jgi:penicillin-binding protein 1C
MNPRLELILNCKQWAKRHPWLTIALLVSVTGLTLRLIPYSIPIRASHLVQDDQAIEFRDRNGLPLGTLLTRDQNHTAVIPLKQVSPNFVNAILAAEDGRFYHHGPLDLKAIARALRDAAQTGRIVSGASTITMQLARMIDPFPSTVWGKTQEVWLSWRLAAGMRKDEILQAYINRLPMGGNVYGVEAAAQLYFGTSASTLTLAQASLLAALPNSPTQLNPYQNWSALKRRQSYVLRRMVQEKYLSQTKANQVYQEAVALQPRQQGILAAPHFLFWTAQQLPSSHPTTIQTTLDLPLQQFVEAQVQQVLRSLTAHNVHQAAALVLENATGKVLAYVGSADYFDPALGRNDGVQALRQPGSALKPFLYQLALEQQRIKANTILADVPTHYAIPGARLYSPQDYSESFQGPVRVRFALANSLNVPAVRVLEQVGVAAFRDRLQQLGFIHLTKPPEHYGLGLALGSGEVSLWELARAYATMARQGRSIELAMLKAQRSLPAQSVGTPATWSLITDMLSDAHARARAFGVESVLQLPFPAAVKTGTSSNYRDTWTIGFTTNYTVATWVGNFDGQPMQQISGVTGAAPLWNRIMLHLHHSQEPVAFSPPNGMVQRPICAVSGFKPTPACPSIVQEYFWSEDLPHYDRQADPIYQTVNNSSTYKVNLPAEYRSWQAKQPQATQVTSTLKIVFPKEGDYFLLHSPDPSQPRQQLEFKLIGDRSQAVEWRLNGTILATQRAQSLFWTPHPGQWTLEARSGNQVDRIRFEVQQAKAIDQRRGFSVVKK